MSRLTPMIPALAALVAAALFLAAPPARGLQGFPTDTPAAVDLGAVAPPPQEFGPTVTPTRTPTPPGPVQLEALGVANVRSGPDTGEALLGEIRPGEYYNVIRRYYRWIEFQFDPAPNRRGWVFDELVRFIGDESQIPVVESLSATVEGAPDVDATSTILALTQTPGGLLTATAAARSPVTPGAIDVATAVDGAVAITPPDQAPPTFTFPPGIVALAPTDGPSLSQTATEAPPAPPPAPGRVPPILPIALLGGFGLLGLVVSALRR